MPGKISHNQVLMAHAWALMVPREVATLPHALMVSEAAPDVRILAFFFPIFYCSSVRKLIGA